MSTPTQPTTVVDLPDEMRSTLRRTLNSGAMVTWINADLFKRAHHDVRTSGVLYDDAGVFVMAIDETELNAKQRQAIFDATREYSKITYFSKGI